jgi:two-component system, NtrC family, nitrogen regulation sensor histidine kinase NtrY
MPFLGRKQSHRGDAILISVIYLVSSVGLYLFMDRAIALPAADAGVRGGALQALFLLLPAALGAIFVALLYRLIQDVRAKRWGAVTRARSFALFLACAFLSVMPPLLVLGAQALRAYQAPASQAVRDGLDAGLERLLAYYEEQERDLQYAAEVDLGPVLAARGPDAAAAYAALNERNPAVAAVELYHREGGIGYFGPPDLRSNGALPAESSGFLQRFSSAGASYSRYFTREAGVVPDGRLIAAAVTMRVEEEAERSAERLRMARQALPVVSALAGQAEGSLRFFGLAFGLSLLALAALFAILASDSLVEPLVALEDAIRRIDAGAAKAAYLAKPGDEAGRLIEALNAALSRIERHKGDQMRSERLLAWQDMARRLAHELRNPLTPIRLSAERVLKRWRDSPDTISGIIEKSMGAIVRESAAMEGLLAEFRDFARLPEPHKARLKLRELVEESIYLFETSWPKLALDIEGVDANVCIRADKGLLKQVLVNLVSNAADATGGGGHVWIRSDLVKTEDSRYCRLQLRDDGPGIAPEIGDRIFTPYFSTKPTGTGLGLAIVEHIVAAHGGSIRYESPPGQGTLFIIDLPADDVSNIKE